MGSPPGPADRSTDGRVEGRELRIVGRALELERAMRDLGRPLHVIASHNATIRRSATRPGAAPALRAATLGRRMTIRLRKGGDNGTGSVLDQLGRESLAASRALYQKLGFETFGGDASQHWLIMKNGDATIGLFQGMFESNILTFNPGWDANASNLDSYVDVREIQRRLRARGVEFVSEADEATTGPANFVVVDPDGNAILIDQHV